MRLVLTGGGTGGHIYPALALAEAFAAEPAFAPLDMLFVGTRDRLEAQIVPKSGVPIAYVRAAPLSRTPSLSLFGTIFQNVAGVVQSLAVLHRARPDVMIATGGYVTFPVVLALRLVRALGRSRAKVALLETNAAYGLTNRLLAPLVDEIWYALEPERRLPAKAAVVGTPVRATMRRHVERHAARETLGIERDKTTVVAMGGSQGANTINAAVADLASAGLPERWQFVLIAGSRESAMWHDRLRDVPGVTVLAYLDDPRVAYAAADVVLARAGASTLGELSATGTPALLVPYPYATADHQSANARAYAATGRARVIADAELDASRLRAELERLLAPARLAEMQRFASDFAERDACAAVVARVKAWFPANVSRP